MYFAHLCGKVIHVFVILLLSKQRLSSIMGRRCVAAGCGLHLCGFPKDPELRKKWADQVSEHKTSGSLQIIAVCAASILKMTSFSHTAS